MLKHNVESIRLLKKYLDDLGYDLVVQGIRGHYEYLTNLMKQINTEIKNAVKALNAELQVVILLFHCGEMVKSRTAREHIVHHIILNIADLTNHWNDASVPKKKPGVRISIRPFGQVYELSSNSQSLIKMSDFAYELGCRCDGKHTLTEIVRQISSSEKCKDELRGYTEVEILQKAADTAFVFSRKSILVDSNVSEPMKISL